MRILSLDPSINNVGWTIFQITPALEEEFRQVLKGGPSKEGLTKPDAGFKLAVQKENVKAFATIAKPKVWRWGTFMLEGSSLMMRIVDLYQKIQLLGGKFDYLITEKPAFYSSEAGQIAARQNYTIDLAAVAFYIAGRMQMDHRQHHPITAITWKGSVTKKVTERKFFRKFGTKTKGITEHSIDSTMLLHYWLQTYAVLSPLIVRHTSPELIRLLL